MEDIPSQAVGCGCHPALDFPPQPESYEARDLEVPETVQRAEELSALQLVETILQQSDAPPCAIINDAGNAVYIHGRTGRFLEPPEGKASVNIVEMARRGLKTELAAAIREVATHKQETVHRGLQVDYDGGKLFLNLTVKPILEQIAMRGLMMVVFEETAAPTKQEKRSPKRVTVKRRGKSVEELEQELQYTKESLQTTIEELETSERGVQVDQRRAAIDQRGTAEHERRVGDFQRGTPITQRGVGHRQRGASGPHRRVVPRPTTT